MAAMTKDGRRVQATYDGNIYVVHVDEAPGSHYAKRTWTLAAGCSKDYYARAEQEIADNNGKPTPAMIAEALR